FSHSSRPHLRPPLFPYTTLFRSGGHGGRHPHANPGLVQSPPGKGVLQRLGRERRDRLVAGDEIDRHPLARQQLRQPRGGEVSVADRKSTRLNSSHVAISYAVFCL